MRSYRVWQGLDGVTVGRRRAGPLPGPDKAPGAAASPGMQCPALTSQAGVSTGIGHGAPAGSARGEAIGTTSHHISTEWDSLGRGAAPGSSGRPRAGGVRVYGRGAAVAERVPPLARQEAMRLLAIAGQDWRAARFDRPYLSVHFRDARECYIQFGCLRNLIPRLRRAGIGNSEARALCQLSSECPPCGGRRLQCWRLLRRAHPAGVSRCWWARAGAASRRGQGQGQGQGLGQMPG